MPEVPLHPSHQPPKAPEGQRIILKGPQHGHRQVRHPAGTHDFLLRLHAHGPTRHASPKPECNVSRTGPSSEGIGSDVHKEFICTGLQAQGVHAGLCVGSVCERTVIAAQPSPLTVASL